MLHYYIQHRKTILSYRKLNKVKTIISYENIIKMKAENLKKFKLV